MQLVEKHVIRKTDPRYKFIDHAAFASKNLYNAALYEIRQHFIFCRKYLNYNHMDKRMQKHEAYGALPRKVSQQVLKLQKRMSRNHHTSRELECVAAKRTRRIDHYMHTTSRRIIDLLVQEGIGTLVIGKNPCWKQESPMRKKDNQHFVQISHARFIDMMTYKACLVGIQVILQEESYTSKASFLDLDPLPVYWEEEEEEKLVFSGKRIKRGMYQSRSGIQLNADINGSYNTMRKALSNVFTDNEIGDVNKALASFVVHPERIVVPLRTQMSRKR